MYKMTVRLMISVFLIALPVLSFADDTENQDRKELQTAMDKLSASTLIDGAGPDAYASVMADDYSRWTVGGSVLNDKTGWVDGMKEWYTEGWRVKSRKIDNLELKIVDGFAFVRKFVEETYVGPDGDESLSKSALAETWIKREGQWLLFQVNIIVVE